jgi:tape measure domain
MGVANREGALYMATGIDNSGLYSGVKQAEGVLQGFDNTARRIGTAMGGYFIFNQFKELSKDIINVRGDLQMLETSFDVLLGGKGTSNFLSELKQFAVDSPLSMNGVSKAAQTLLGFGIEAEKIIPTIKQIGDISMGNEDRFNSLSLAFAQMSATGRLMGQDLNQMINAGFNPLQEMADKTGKSIAALKKEMEGGAISSEMVAKAFASATAEGGKFYGMTERQAEGIEGLQAQLEGGIQEAYNEIGKSQESLIAGGYKAAISLIENYEKIGKTLVSLVAAYGTYKAALVLTTATQSGYTVAQLSQYRALLLLEKAQKAFNATALKNPYVLLTTIIVSAATAIYLFADRTTAAERAQKRFNKVQEEAKRKADEQKQGLEELIRVMQDETSAQSQRLKAMNLIKEQYPQLFAKYVDEKGHVKDLIGLWKEYNEAAEVKTLQDSKDRAQQIRDRIRVLEQKKLDIEDKNPSIDTRSYALVISTLRQDLKLINKDVQEQSNLQWEANTPVEVRKKLLEDEIAILKERNKELSKPKNFVEKDSGDFPLNIPDAQRIAEEQANLKKIQRLESDLQKLNEAESKAPMYGADYKAAKTEWEEAKVELAKIAADKNKFTTQQYEEAKKAEEAAKKKYEELGGVTRADKQTKDAQKEAQKIADANLELIKAEKKAALDREQAKLDNDQSRLNLEEDSFNKRLKQIELNHKKEQLAIERHEQQLIEAQQARERKEWEKSGSKGIFTPKTVVLSGEDKDIIDNQTKINNDRIKVETTALYRELLDKYQDYATKRAAIEKKFNDDIAVMSANNEGGKNNAAIAEARRQYKEALSSIDLEEFQKNIEWSSAFSNLDRQSTEAIKKLRDTLKKHLQDAGDALTPENFKIVADAIEDMNNKLTERKPIETLTSSFGEYRKASERVAAAQKKINDLQKLGYKSAEDLKEATDELRKAEEARAESLSKMTKAVNEIGQKGGELASSAREIIEMFENFGMEVSDSTKKIVDGVGQMMAGLEKIDLTNPMSAITGGITTLAGLGNTIVGIFGNGNDDAKLQKNIERYEAMISAIDKVIDKQKALLSTMSGGESVKQAEQITKMLESRQKHEQEVLSNWLKSGKSMFSRSEGHKINNKQKDVLADMGIKDIKEALDWTADMWTTFMTNHYDSWSKLPEEVRKYAESVMDAEDATSGLRDTLDEINTGVSFDSFRDSFIDGLMDIDSTAEDVANNIEKYFQRAMLSSLVNDKYADQIRALYDQFSAANEDGNIDEVEYANLQRAKKELAEAITKERDAIKETFDWANTSSDNSLKGAYGKASQESINLLAGQTGAQRVSVDAIRGDTAFIKDAMGAMKEVNAQQLAEVKAIRELTAKIEGHNQVISTMSTKIADNTNGINNIAQSLKDIDTHGLIMK